MENSLQPRIAAVIGLGNPGNAYDKTRHNLGFEVVDRLRGAAQFIEGIGSYFFCEIAVDSGEIVLLKPTTYMNRSGLAVAHLAESRGLTPPQLLVVADDFNLPLGRIRLRKGGSDGGHKGLASIIYQLASDDFPRIRMGIGPTPPDRAAEDFVLERFTEQEQPVADEMIERAARAALTWINEGFDKAAAQFNPANGYQRAIDDN
jgi:PTH1 family peptidyl-tRNA hydrolase